MQVEILSLVIFNFFLLIFFQLLLRKVFVCNEDKALLLIWLILPLPLILVEYYLGVYDIVTVAAVTYLAAGAWIVSYPAIYAASPTLVILLLIEKGINEEESLANKSFTGGNSKERINDAFKFGFISLKNGEVSLTNIGKYFYKFMCFFKWIHGIDKVEPL